MVLALVFTVMTVGVGLIVGKLDGILTASLVYKSRYLLNLELD